MLSQKNEMINKQQKTVVPSTKPSSDDDWG